MVNAWYKGKKGGEYNCAGLMDIAKPFVTQIICTIF